MPITLMKEETLSSFAIRLLHISGTIDISRVSAPLFALNGEWKLFPLPNRELVKIYAAALETKSKMSIIRNHTLAPIYRPVSLYLDRFLKDRLTEHSENVSLANASSGLFDKTEVTTAPTRYCPLCFEEQINEFGFTWFKREWQIHRMGGCLEHGCRLLSRCDCGKKPVKINEIIALMQGRCTQCESNPWIPRPNDTEITFARWLTNFFKVNMKPFSDKLTWFLMWKSHVMLETLDTVPKGTGYFFSHLYDPYNINYDYKFGTKGTFFPRTYSQSVTRLFNARSSTSISYTMLFHPLSLAFPRFKDFVNYVEEISYPSFYPYSTDALIDIKPSELSPPEKRTKKRSRPDQQIVLRFGQHVSR